MDKKFVGILATCSLDVDPYYGSIARSVASWLVAFDYNLIFGGCSEGATGAIYDDKQMICNHSCSVIVSYESLKGVENKSIKGSIKKWTSKSREELEIISQNYNLNYILAILNSNMSYSYLNSIRKHRIRNYFYPDDLKIQGVAVCVTHKLK